jgi:hypothetical protein
MFERVVKSHSFKVDGPGFEVSYEAETKINIFGLFVVSPD